MAEEAATRVNQLVALASTAALDLQGKRRDAPERHPVTFLQTRSADGSGVDKRTAKILDAIAAILVSARIGEIYAVGAQIVHNKRVEKGAVKLFVASNQEVPPATKDYLGEIWAILQEMANNNHKMLPPNSRMRSQKFVDDTPPKNATGEETIEMSDKFQALIRTVHSHCSPKWTKRIQKGSSSFKTFSSTFVKDTMRTLPPEDPIIKPLLFLFIQYSWVLRAINNNNLQVVIDDDKFPENMWRAQRAVRQLEPMFTRMDEINAGIGNGQKQISRILKKFAGFQAEVDELERFSRSPRFYRVLKKGNFNIVCLGEEKSDVQVSLTQSGWEEVLQDAIKTAGYMTNEKSKMIIKDASTSKLTGKGTVPSPVHAECKVLEYFAQQNLLPRPLSYIGGSKLFCAGCAAVFEAWNEGQTKRFSRGSHGKWYFPWAVPTGFFRSGTENATLVQSIYEKAATNFAKLLNAAGLAERRLSDSSVPSATTSGTEVDDSWGITDDLLQQLNAVQ